MGRARSFNRRACAAVAAAITASLIFTGCSFGTSGGGPYGEGSVQEFERATDVGTTEPASTATDEPVRDQSPESRENAAEGFLNDRGALPRSDAAEIRFGGSMPQGVEGPFRVDRVVDGDTVRVLINGESVSVRLIGLDTPEIVHPQRPVECFGREASDRAKQLLDGETVYLEFDPTQGREDRFGRALAFVWFDDGRLFNYEMIAAGYGHEYTFRAPYRYQEEFKAAQRAASDNDRGLWHPDTCAGVVE
ncbi:hypothetical protein GCM10011410_23130 [Hoyosella rhizosphaerae]|uniref:TNase-like domain-containing protein n=2 Tax=Hoyosella rhizosphaerae TaxID=1755582 RepID=A0A916UE52_9ACTN|nr:hypothetical protein GCM10011410_23130 [Hoyosella rhizosphaerae]